MKLAYQHDFAPPLRLLAWLFLVKTNQIIPVSCLRYTQILNCLDPNYEGCSYKGTCVVTFWWKCIFLKANKGRQGTLAPVPLLPTMMAQQKTILLSKKPFSSDNFVWESPFTNHVECRQVIFLNILPYTALCTFQPLATLRHGPVARCSAGCLLRTLNLHVQDSSPLKRPVSFEILDHHELLANTF